MTTAECLRDRLRDLATTVSQIDALVEAGTDFAPLLTAKVLVEIDSYANCAARCLDSLQMARPRTAEPAKAK